MTSWAVLFDFDGVLVDSEPIYDQLTRELLAELADGAGLQQRLEVDLVPERLDEVLLPRGTIEVRGRLA